MAMKSENEIRDFLRSLTVSEMQSVLEQILEILYAPFNNASMRLKKIQERNAILSKQIEGTKNESERLRRELKKIESETAWIGREFTENC